MAPHPKITDAQLNDLNDKLDTLRDLLAQAPPEFRLRASYGYEYLRDITQAVNALSLQQDAQALEAIAQKIGSTTANAQKLKQDLEATRNALQSIAQVTQALAPLLILL